MALCSAASDVPFGPPNGSPAQAAACASDSPCLTEEYALQRLQLWHAAAAASTSTSVEHVVPAEVEGHPYSDLRLCRYGIVAFPAVLTSSKRANRAARAGHLRANGRVVDGAYAVRPQDRLTLELPASDPPVPSGPKIAKLLHFGRVWPCQVLSWHGAVLLDEDWSFVG